jgi:hypothetical protein
MRFRRGVLCTIAFAPRFPAREFEMKTLLPAAVIAAAVAAPQSALAVTHCTAKVVQIWAGSDGNLWINYQTADSVSGSAVIASSNPNRESMLAMAMTAMTTSRKFTVRYEADGVSCQGARYDIVGVYLEG